MDININNLPLYNIFLEVASSKNLSVAASRLFISQPAVSKAIKKLEEQLHSKLFIRSSRGVKLTDDGELLYMHISQAFSEIFQGENLIKTRHSLGVSKIRFGASNTLCKYLLLPKLKNYVKLYPHINISIDCQSSNHTVKKIETKDIDIGLIAYLDEVKDLTLFPAGTIQDTFVVSPEYLKNLLVRENIDITNSFSRSNLMMLTKDNVTRKYVDSFISDYISHDTKIMEIGSMDLLIEFAKTGLGIGCVIREFVERELEDGTLIEVIPPGLEIKKRQVCYCINSKSTPDKATQSFLNFIKSPVKNPFDDISQSILT